jgi:hypothetical protein
MARKHDQCMMTNRVLVVAESESAANRYMRNKFPISVVGKYAGSIRDIVGECPEHVLYCVVPGSERSTNAMRALAMLEEHGFTRGMNPRDPNSSKGKKP